MGGHLGNGNPGDPKGLPEDELVSPFSLQCVISIISPSFGMKCGYANVFAKKATSSIIPTNALRGFLSDNPSKCATIFKIFACTYCHLSLILLLYQEQQLMFFHVSEE